MREVSSARPPVPNSSYQVEAKKTGFQAAFAEVETAARESTKVSPVIEEREVGEVGSADKSIFSVSLGEALLLGRDPFFFS